MWKFSFGRCIYTSPSGYKVYQNPFYRWLTTNSSAYQTALNRRNPANPALNYLPALTLMVRQYPGPCCILGLGGAGIPHMLNKTTPSVKLIAVDYSLEVIEISKKFFYADTLQNLSIIHQNAYDFVQETQQKFKHLMVDLYDAHQYPKHCMNASFFEASARLLEPDGFFAFNSANNKQLFELMKLIRMHFKHTVLIPVPKSSNSVLIASPMESGQAFFDTIRHNGEISSITWIDLWGYVGSQKTDL